MIRLAATILSDQAGEYIARAPGRERHDHPHRPIGIDAFAGLPLRRAAGKQAQADGCCDPFLRTLDPQSVR
jgi:hypothetical protein